MDPQFDRSKPTFSGLPVDHLSVNVQEFYWFSTTSKYDINYSWVLNIKDGAVGLGYKPLSEFYLWPVRGT